ncbi:MULTISPECIES: hypothetical protein [Paenibacillus]|uniref:hypothetical protein n=1 Tax=Paenibacillus TaxID=44249 RepID=UPI00096E9EA6|nr:hypothetical protein [Paenibacillus amylolyticus]OMF43073.1 hypothetical protein BK136_15130 [Paenibacillus amylolyticus]
MVTYTENLIPIMTSDTTPKGRTFASSFNLNGAFMAFDNSDTYGFVSGNGSVGQLGYEFVNSVRIGKYVVRSLSSTYFAHMPKSWTFEGTNDGVSWTILDTQSNQIWTTANTDKEYIIDYNKAKRYKTYRLNWTSNNGGAQVVINELKMFGVGYFDKFLISSEDTTYSLYRKIGKPLIPLMDGYENTIGSVIGSASYSTGYTWKAFDSDDTTAYGTNFIPDSSKPIYVGFRFNDPVCVKRYSFLAGLRTFKFMASNNGTTWDTLDTQTSLVSNTSTIQMFDIQNDKLYSYYKLEATLATSGNAWVSIFSVQFYGLMPSILLECPSSEGSYIRNGMDKGFQIDTVEVLNVKQHIKEDSIPLGSGKLFRQPIDREKHRAKKIILG